MPFFLLTILIIRLLAVINSFKQTTCSEMLISAICSSLKFKKMTYLILLSLKKRL